MKKHKKSIIGVVLMVLITLGVYILLKEKVILFLLVMIRHRQWSSMILT